jgi:hypothetical protein
MQSSDLTKFKFAANIAGPYCSACCAGGGGVGPTGPTGPTGPAGGGSPSTWSQYPATQAVDVNCNFLNDVSGINFCDGTYIGPGGSFDISSNQTIVIKSTQDTEIRHYTGANVIDTHMRVEGNGTMSVVNPSAQGVEIVCFDGLDNSTSIRGKSDTTALVVAQSANLQGGSFLRFEEAGTGITLKTGNNPILLDAGGPATVQSGTSVALTSGGSLSAFAGGASMTFTTAFEGTYGVGTTTFSTGNINISNENGQTATMSVRTADGEFEIESAKGIQMDVANGVAAMALRDTAGAGSIDLTTTGGNININSGSKVVVSCSDFEVGPSNQATNIQSGTSIDLNAANGAAQIAMNSSGMTLTAVDTGLGQTVNMSLQPNINSITANCPNGVTFNGLSVSAFNGAVEGAEMGYDTSSTNNFVRGLGLNFEMKQSLSDPKYIRLENNPAEKIIMNADTGSVEVFGQNGVFAGIPNGGNPDTGLSVGAGAIPSAKLIIDSATASAGLQYDGTAGNPVQFHFNSADFISGSAGAATGQYLRIFINNVEYKIALLNP